MAGRSRTGDLPHRVPELVLNFIKWTEKVIPLEGTTPVFGSYILSENSPEHSPELSRKDFPEQSNSGRGSAEGPALPQTGWAVL